MTRAAHCVACAPSTCLHGLQTIARAPALPRARSSVRVHILRGAVKLREQVPAAVSLATSGDVSWLVTNDEHVSRAVIENKVQRGECLVARCDGVNVGWLRWSYFWDEIPFMNMLKVDAAHRGQQHGRTLVLAWEQRMLALGVDRVLTSSLSDETAQHFYRKLGYRDTGSLLLPGEALEIIFSKQL